MRCLSALLLLVMLAPASARAQAIVTSTAPQSTSVTVYRDPERGEGAIDARFSRGFALVSETRRITLPAGESVVRFEGVADGMIAVSAVVTGLPGGVIEQNRDARLLSPAALLDGSLGNLVHLRRTNRATGVVSEQDAVIRSGPDGAVVLETAQGVEALRCSGLPETIVYDAVPSGLSARPVFSVHTVSPAATNALVTLTYLATGFDWGANYVARLADDGRHVDLFAWMSVANMSSVSFPQSQLLAVAGRLNRETDYQSLVARPPALRLALRCWPAGTTRSVLAYVAAPPPPPPPPPPVAEEIVVTAARRELMTMAAPAPAMVAQQEELGDLKLYRVPAPVDVNANGMKLVALLERRSVPATSYYAASLWTLPMDDPAGQPMARMLRMKNSVKGGLGLPLPSGGLALFGPAGGETLLIADSRMRDHAIDEDVEIEAGESDQVRITLTTLSGESGRRRAYRAEISNATDRPVATEIKVAPTEVTGFDPSRRLSRKDGAWLWSATIPANGRVALDYAVRAED
ncbi:hypothetical protein PX699_29255 [Sphingobium sp. H39-3-25]|uniref:DUF4139 domain-containing protein n=1 Tax=Sphingobium arseniciresistens TaxID=3030834 RepID=UPI0023B9C77C|nr:hypothetical protein [Sphingobium arseniciresistens]